MYVIIKLLQTPNAEINADYTVEFSTFDWAFVLTGHAHVCMHTYMC